MREQKFVMSPSDQIILTVREPAIIYVRTEPDGAQVFDQREVQTIEGLRKRISDLQSLVSSQRFELRKYER